MSHRKEESDPSKDTRSSDPEIELSMKIREQSDLDPSDELKVIIHMR